MPNRAHSCRGILPPYVLSGAYALKLALSGETYENDPGRRTRDMIVGADENTSRRPLKRSRSRHLLRRPLGL